jgi:hypothetical protein
MASSNTPYAAVSFDNPSASLYPTRPVPLLLLLIAVVLGALTGCGFVLFSLVRPFRVAWPAMSWKRGEGEQSV